MYGSKKIETIKIENCKISNVKNIFKEIYKRTVIPLYIPLLVLTTFFLVLFSKENSFYNKFKFIIFSTGLIFIIFSEITIRLISDKLLNNIYISALPFLCFIILYLIIYKKLNFNFLPK